MGDKTRAGGQQSSRKETTSCGRVGEDSVVKEGFGGGEASGQDLGVDVRSKTEE